MRTIIFLLGICVLFPSTMLAQIQPLPPLMPMPARVQRGSGQLITDQSFSVRTEGKNDPRLQRAVQRFLDQLKHQTGMPLGSMQSAAEASSVLEIVWKYPNKLVQQLGEDESYSLAISSSGAKLDAVTPLGVMRGLQTFLQMVETTSAGFAVPAVVIQDQPRFPWRGLMIDSSRHFTPISVLKRNLDGMAAVKLNVFHWHLSDDQGFRAESKLFPKLQGMGSDGLYYTQAEIRDVIAYARDRGIRVVPEFDMPGHATAWFVGYPELAGAPGPYQIGRVWGISNAAMDPTQERTYKFLDKFIGEMASLFPDKYLHIGGDEVNGKQWNANPRIQLFMRRHGLKNSQDLQAYFNARLQKIVSKHGKIMIGWDEILHPDLPKSIVVQSWRGQASLAQAAALGYRGILSYGYYLDLMWPAGRHYAIDPLEEGAANLAPEEKQRILGGEACMWSEYVSPENIDSRIWPRMAAIAERFWSAEEVKDVNSMYARMQATSHWLDWVGLTHKSNYEPMLRRIAGSDDISSLRTLADVVEPVKDYVREEVARNLASSLTPLNRLVDAARPESIAARQFSALVDALAAGTADAAAKQHIRTSLTLWRDNDENLRPKESSFLLLEDVPLSQALSAVAGTGLQALDYLDRRERAPDTWTSQQLEMLHAAETQKAALLLMVVGPVEKLVTAAGKITPH